MVKFFLYIGVAFLLSCKGKKTETTDTAPKPAGNHIPFALMLAEEVRKLDTIPVSLNLYVSVDSTKPPVQFMERSAFRQLAARFMEPDFSDSLMKMDYSESSYGDATTNTISFHYETTSPNRPVKKVILNFSNGPEGQSRLKWVNLYRESGDTVQRMFWKKGSHCMLSESYTANGQPVEKTTKVFWDGSDMRPEEVTEAPVVEQKDK